MMCYLRESPSPFIIADNDHDTDRLYTSHQFHIAAGVLQFCSVATIAIPILYAWSVIRTQRRTRSQIWRKIL